LRESEQHFRTVADFTHDWEYWTAPDGSIPWMSPSCERVTGYPAAAFQQDPGLLYRICHPEDLGMIMGHVHEIRGEHGIAPVEFRIQRRDGRQVWISHICSPVWDSQGNLAGRRGTNQDITERKQSEATLRRSQAMLARTESLAHIGSWEWEVATDTVTWSEEMFRILQRNPADGPVPYVDHFKIYPPEDMARLQQLVEATLNKGEFYELELHAIRPSGEVRICLDRGFPEMGSDGKVSRLFGTLQDITERKQAAEENARLQAQLQQTQKMESLGTLAGGVAHDMNNALGAILGLATANLEVQAPGSPAYRSFETIAKAATRGGEMVRSLLSFARQGRAEDREVDLNAILREEAVLLERTILSKVQLELDLEPGLRPIRGDAGALTHAIMNLCVNALDAMPEQGTLTLRTRNLDSRWVEVLVEDTGTGMPREVLERALDPFFTTKAVGKGTGLGLSMVYSTMKAHQGQLELHSEPGRGTRVRLRFPACEPAAKAGGQVEEAPSRDPSRSLTVLLVDDDELIQSSIQTLLQALGHAAFTASSGEESLLAIEGGLEPDVVILDMNMPGLGGSGTLPRLRVLLPEVPVLLSTGRTDQTALELAAAHPRVTLLPKPFSLKALEQCLESIWQGR
jgi:PAS domain S-box-containing protein